MKWSLKTGSFVIGQSLVGNDRWSFNTGENVCKTIRCFGKWSCKQVVFEHKGSCNPGTTVLIFVCLFRIMNTSFCV